MVFDYIFFMGGRFKRCIRVLSEKSASSCQNVEPLKEMTWVVCVYRFTCLTRQRIWLLLLHQTWHGRREPENVETNKRIQHHKCKLCEKVDRFWFIWINLTIFVHFTAYIDYLSLSQANLKLKYISDMEHSIWLWTIFGYVLGHIIMFAVCILSW